MAGVLYYREKNGIHPSNIFNTKVSFDRTWTSVCKLSFFIIPVASLTTKFFVQTAGSVVE